MDTKKSTLIYVLGVILCGTNGVAASFIHQDSYNIVLIRSVSAGIFVIAAFFLTGRSLKIYKEHIKDSVFVALSGASMAIQWFFLFGAYKEIGVSIPVTINFFAPAIVVLISPLIFKEKLSKKKLIILCMAVAGFILVTGPAASEGISIKGLLYSVCAAICFAALMICNKKGCRIQGLDNATLEMVAVLITVLIYFFVFKGGIHMHIASGDWPAVIWMGLFAAAMGNVCYFTGFGRIPVQTSAILGYIEPVTSLFLSAIILKEVLSPAQMLGAILIIGGAAWGEMGK